MKARAIVHGAITVVNAIATGKGAALGIDLTTEATVELTDDPGKIEVAIRGEENIGTRLSELVVREVFARYNVRNRGAKVETISQVPVARGLKSSSTASNAVALATITALGKSEDDLTVINIGVDASLKARVTLTGALDDAAASYLGGFVVTNNLNRRILRRDSVDEDMKVLILVPQTRHYTGRVDVERARAVKIVAEEAFALALQGKYLEALAINGLAYSAALGFNPKPSIDALIAGALSAGLSGKGPAVAALCRSEEDAGKVFDNWKSQGGKVIQTKLNRNKAEAKAEW
ncbi:MAG: shikimate kinase [Thaumarchaeota archaeon]|nr:shikimate kinase [Nitrososphaerota archaeon]